MNLTLQRLITGGELADMMDVHQGDIGVDGSKYDAARCVQKAEEAYRVIVDRAAEAGCFELEDSMQFSTTGSGYEKSYAFPERIHTIDRLERWDTTRGGPIGLIYQRGFYDRPGRQVPVGYHVSESYFKVFNGNNSDTYKCTFFRSPGSLAYGTVGDSSDTTNIYLGTPTAGTLSDLDDAYIGDKIAVTYASGAVEVREVTDYVASTGVATVGTAFGSTPTSADSWSFVPFMREAHHLMLVQGTAAMFADRPSTETNMIKFNRSLESYIASMKPLDNGAPQTVRQVYPGAELEQFGSGVEEYGMLP